MTKDDILLVKKYQQGSNEAFAVLYDKYIQKIYSFIYFRTGHKQTAEDLTQKTFVKALEKINSFAETGTFQAWLYRIARNTVIDHFRVRKTEIDISAIFNLAGTENIESEINAKLAVEQVREYVKNIKPEHQEVVILRLWDDLPYQEIEQITGTSEGNCKVIVSRALKSIREHLNER